MCAIKATSCCEAFSREQLEHVLLHESGEIAKRTQLCVNASTNAPTKVCVTSHILAIVKDPYEPLFSGIAVCFKYDTRGVGGNGAIVEAERRCYWNQVDVVAREEKELGLGRTIHEVAQSPVNSSQQVVCLENAAPAKGQVLRQLSALPVHVGDDVANVLHGGAVMVGTGQRLALAHEAHQSVHDWPRRNKLRVVPPRAKHLAKRVQQLHNGQVVLEHDLRLACEEPLVRVKLWAGTMWPHAEVDVPRGHQVEPVK